MTAAISKNQLLTEERLKKAFLLFDKENSGSIGKLEIAEVFGWGDS
jgi:Ca2+-binding EF-hand superfamily protein